MASTLVIMGPALLASMLAKQLEGLSELSSAELENHIREDPAAYYPEYQGACLSSGAPAFPLAVWSDLCAR